MSFIINFLSHNLQMRPLIRSSFADYFFCMNNLVFLKHSLQEDFPQKWQCEFYSSDCFFQGVWQVLHFGVFLYSLWLMGFSKKNIFSSSSNMYYYCPMENTRLASMRSLTLLVPLLSLYPFFQPVSSATESLNDYSKMSSSFIIPAKLLIISA